MWDRWTDFQNVEWTDGQMDGVTGGQVYILNLSATEEEEKILNICTKVFCLQKSIKKVC